VWIEINLVIGALEFKVGKLQEQDFCHFIPKFITQDSSGSGVYAVQISVLRLNEEEVKGMIISSIGGLLPHKNGRTTVDIVGYRDVSQDINQRIKYKQV